MSAGIYKMLCDQGATFVLILTWRDSTGTPINLTGYSAVMRVATTKGAPLALNPTTVNGQIALGGAQGTVTITVSANDTADIAPGQYVYELDVTSGGGVVTRILEGPFMVDGQV
jgi:hypothetical protein